MCDLHPGSSGCRQGRCMGMQYEPQHLTACCVMHCVMHYVVHCVMHNPHVYVIRQQPRARGLWVVMWRVGSTQAMLLLVTQVGGGRSTAVLHAMQDKACLFLFMPCAWHEHKGPCRALGGRNWQHDDSTCEASKTRHADIKRSPVRWGQLYLLQIYLG